MLSSTRRRARRTGLRPRPGTRRALLAVASLLAVTVATLAGLPPASAAATCQDSSPAGGTYTIRVCLTAPDAGQNLTGKVPVTATASVVSGTGPGFQRMVFTLDGQYLLTDYQPPYTFTLDTRRFVDGPYTIGAHVLARDTFVSPDTTVQEAFANGITTQPVNTRTFTPPQGTPVATGDTFTVAAAGDGAGGDASETAVTNLMSTMNPNLVLYLGDVYEKGTSTEFDNWYGDNQPDSPFYGRLRLDHAALGRQPRVRGQPGTRLLRLLGQRAALLQRQPARLAHHRPGLELGVRPAEPDLRRSTSGCSKTWPRNTQPCTLAFFHHPRFNIGDEGPVDGGRRLLEAVRAVRRGPRRQRPRPHLPALRRAGRQRQPRPGRGHRDHQRGRRSRARAVPGQRPEPRQRPRRSSAPSGSGSTRPVRPTASRR